MQVSQAIIKKYFFYSSFSYASGLKGELSGFDFAASNRRRLRRWCPTSSFGRGVSTGVHRHIASMVLWERSSTPCNVNEFVCFRSAQRIDMPALTGNPRGWEQKRVISHDILTSTVIKVSEISTSLIIALSPFPHSIWYCFKRILF